VSVRPARRQYGAPSKKTFDMLCRSSILSCSANSGAWLVDRSRLSKLKRIVSFVSLVDLVRLKWSVVASIKWLGGRPCDSVTLAPKRY
jgi:hypothetical protein